MLLLPATTSASPVGACRRPSARSSGDPGLVGTLSALVDVGNAALRQGLSETAADAVMRAATEAYGEILGSDGALDRGEADGKAALARLQELGAKYAPHFAPAVAEMVESGLESRPGMLAKHQRRIRDWETP